MKILHIGCLVEDLQKSISDYELLGFRSMGESVVNNTMKVIGHYIQNDSTVIELIAPIDGTSIISKLLKKLGPGPYHLCYESYNLAEDVKKLRKKGYVIVSSGEKSESEARSFAFLYNLNIGFVELIET